MFRVATAHALGTRTPTAYAHNVKVVLSPAPLNFATGQLLRESRKCSRKLKTVIALPLSRSLESPYLYRPAPPLHPLMGVVLALYNATGTSSNPLRHYY